MSYTVRLYTNDDSFFRRLARIPAGVREIQVALAFARDYDLNNNPTKGNFRPYWDTQRVTATEIAQLRGENPPNKVKVLVSIGDRSDQYPFTIEAGERDIWVSNATESLTSIINDYNLDGIDVYYEKIETGQQDFVYCIGHLMANLRERNRNSVASIAPTARLNANFYFPLYRGYHNYIGTVVYQCFTEPEPINSVEGLGEIFNAKANQYPKNKLLAGYSTIFRDWARVSPALYFIALFQLLNEETVAGPAICVISDSPGRGVTTNDSATTFVILERILEVVSLARNG